MLACFNDCVSFFSTQLNFPVRVCTLRNLKCLNQSTLTNMAYFCVIAQLGEFVIVWFFWMHHRVHTLDTSRIEISQSLPKWHMFVFFTGFHDCMKGVPNYFPLKDKKDRTNIYHSQSGLFFSFTSIVRAFNCSICVMRVLQ